MTYRVSVLLSTHNPDMGRLYRTLNGLFEQTLPAGQWELIVVDNGSTPALDFLELGLPRQSHARLIREERLGLIFGRITGIENSTGELIVFCDDDNLLAHDFLAHALQIFTADPCLGNASGKALPEFEITPPSWITEFEGCLALRDFGDERRIVNTSAKAYPEFAFGGGGAVFRREALTPFLTAFGNGNEVCILGRSGKDLTSGEDNNFIFSVAKAGFSVGYFPELVMTHLIPAQRLDQKYLARLNHGIAKSWVQVLASNGVCPWKPAAKWTVPLRKLRAYFRYQAWAGPAEYIRWRGACGHFEGRALIG
jgi:glycosyltransferase involved in cell wall biosynthesis